MPLAYVLTVNARQVTSPSILTEGGSIWISEGPNGSSNRYIRDTRLTLDPRPDGGYTFQGWGGDCFAYGIAQCQLTMSGDRSVTATFAQSSASTSTPTPTLTATVTYVEGKGRFNSGDASGDRITVPVGSLVNVYLTLKANTTTGGQLKVEVRKDIISGSDETKETCESSVVLIAGETELLACQFTADDPVEPSFRHYFMRVYWNDELIYDPTDPDTREAVTIEQATPTPTPTPSPTVTETLIVPFKKQSGEPAGSTTANTYEKLVRLTISGTGIAAPNWGENDAFYHYVQDTNNCELTGFPLNLSFDGNSDSGHGQLVSKLIVWESSIGEVAPPHCPTYQASHLYDIVVDLGSQSGLLTLGPGDAGYDDNTGSFTIEVEQLVGLPSVTPTPTPTPAPILSMVVFVASRDGNDEIYIMNADGSNQTRLTNNAARESDPAWSPDHNRIAFVSRRDGNDELYVMNSDGSNVIRLTDNPFSDVAPTWSPDGGKIAFQTDRHETPSDNNWEIYIMNSDGANPTRLTNHIASDWHPSWSPDGSKIAFSSRRANGRDEIWIINSDGSGPNLITTSGAPINDEYPAWSPNGAKIAFTRFLDGNREIYSMNADGSNQVRLTFDSDPNDTYVDQYPDWSPDGARIVFTSTRDGGNQIYIMDSDGGNVTRLTTPPCCNEKPSW